MNTVPHMGVSYIGLLALASLAALVFLALLGLIALLTNPRSRDAAKILVGGLVALVLLVVLVGGLFVGVARPHAIVQNRVARAQVEQELARFKQAKRQIELDEASETAAVDIARPAADVAPSPDSATVKAAEPAPAEATADSAKAESAEHDDHASAGNETKSQTEATKQETVVLEKPEPLDSAQAKSAEHKGTVAADHETKANPEQTNEKTVAPKKPVPSASTELSVPPLVDDDRPAWVGRKPYKEGSVYYWPIATDPSPDSADAEDAALPKALHVALSDYINNKLQLGSDAAGRVHLEPDYLRNQMVGDDIWVEPLSLSVGEFVRMHALVKFDRQTNQIIHQQWQQHRMTERLLSAAGILCVVLIFLALVYCYLKISLITGGSRRGLLRIAAILVILGLMLVAAALASAGMA